MTGVEGPRSVPTRIGQLSDLQGAKAKPPGPSSIASDVHRHARPSPKTPVRADRVTRRGSQRRAFPRLRMELRPDIHLLDGTRSLGVRLRGSTHQLDGTGMRLSLHLPDMDLSWVSALLTGRLRLAIRIQLPGTDRTVSVNGRVTWAEAFRDLAQPLILGVRFDQASFQDRRTLFRFMLGARRSRGATTSPRSLTTKRRRF